MPRYSQWEPTQFLAGRSLVERILKQRHEKWELLCHMTLNTVLNITFTDSFLGFEKMDIICLKDLYKSCNIN